MTSTVSRFIHELDSDALDEAEEWADLHGGELPDVWEKMPRGDWLAGLAAGLEVDRKSLVRAVRRCVETSLSCLGEHVTDARAVIRAIEEWEADTVSERAVMEASWQAYSWIQNPSELLNSGGDDAMDACVWLAYLVYRTPEILVAEEDSTLSEALASYVASAVMALERAASSRAFVVCDRFDDSAWKSTFIDAAESLARIMRDGISWVEIEGAARTKGLLSEK